MADEQNRHNRDETHTGIFLTVAGIFIVALVLGFVFMDSRSPYNDDMNTLAPAAGNWSDNNNAVPPAPAVPAQ